MRLLRVRLLDQVDRVWVQVDRMNVQVDSSAFQVDRTRVQVAQNHFNDKKRLPQIRADVSIEQ